MAHKKKILVVDDDKDALALIRTILAQEKKYEILMALVAEEALDILENQEVDLVISDLRMPGMSGADFLKELRNWDRTLPVIFVSGWGKEQDWLEALQDQASALISKPFRKDAILKAVSKALEQNGAAA